MASKYLKKHKIPETFTDILSDFTKEILRNQPLDIIDFACEYFRCMEEGVLLEYVQKGDNLPCDYKPIVPEKPNRVRVLNKLRISTEDQLRVNRAQEIISIRTKENGYPEETKEEEKEEAQNEIQDIQKEEEDRKSVV